MISRSQTKKSYLLTASYILFAGLLFTFSVIYAAEGGWSLLLLCAIILSLVMPIAYHAIADRLDILEPLILANVALGVMFVGRPLMILDSGQTMHLGYNVMTTFNEALLVAMIGVIAFQFGYFSNHSKKWACALPSPPAFIPSRVALLGWLYGTVGTLLFGFFLLKGGGLSFLLSLLEGRGETNNIAFLNSSGYFYQGILLYGAAALIFFATGMVTKRSWYFLAFLPMFVPLLIFYGARGTRSQLLPIILAIPTFWFLFRQRRPKVKSVLIGVLLGLSILGWQREIRTAGGIYRDAPFQALLDYLSSPQTAAMEILSGADTEMFDSLANILIVVPEKIPFQHGATFIDILVRAVPRPLWPDKPLESNDVLVDALWPKHYAVSRAAPAFSVIGIFYADSGLVTVVIGMYLIGVITATLWHWRTRHGKNVLAQMIYSMALAFVIILLRGTIPDTLGRMLFLVVPLLLLLHFSRIRRFSITTKIKRIDGIG